METFQYHCQRLKDIPLLYTRSQLQVETEGLGSFVTSISKFFATQLEKIGHFLNPEVSEFKMKTDPFVVDLNKAAKRLNKVYSKDFISYKDSLIGVTQGFKGDLFSASTELNGVLRLMDPIFLPAIQQANDQITKIMASKDYAMSTRPVKINSERDKALKAGYALIDKFIDPSSGQDQMKLSQLIPNFTSLQQVVDNINSTEALSIFHNCVQADKEIAAIKTRVDTLLDKVIKNKDRSISKNALSQLSMELEETAKLITLISTLMFFKSQICKITTNIINQFA